MSVSPRGGWLGVGNGGQWAVFGLGTGWPTYSGMPDSVLGMMALRGEKRGMGLSQPPCPLLYSSGFGGLHTSLLAMMFWWKLRE